MGSGPSRFQIKPIKIRLYYIEAAPQCQPHPIDRPAKISRFAREAFLYPNGGTAESVSSAREAGSRSARGHMLAQSLPASPPAEGAPEWQDGKIFQFCTRSRQSICQRAHARTYLLLPRKSSSHSFPYHIPIRGYGGVPPCLPIALDLEPHPSPLFGK